MILLDTHAAIWLAMDDNALGDLSRALIKQAMAEGATLVSAISFWEIALLVAKRRFDVRQSPASLRNRLLDTGVSEIPLTGDIAMLAAELDNLHGDPADRFIVATAIVHDATLMTADSALLHWRHKLKRQNASK